jgi:hypothetical protein
MPYGAIWQPKKTIIKESKGNGEIVGLTRKKSALIRWTLTLHVLGHFSSEMHNRSGLATEIEASHEETKPAAMKRNEQQVNDLIDHIRNKMTDPFDVALHPALLINISTGMHASKDVQDSLLNSIDEGTKMAKSFVKGSLSNGQSDIRLLPFNLLRWLLTFLIDMT